MSYFKKLKISNWQQFHSIDIDFHDRLTILTGANASGKITILNLLARHTNWEVPFLAVPSQYKLKGAFHFLIRLFDWFLVEEGLKKVVDVQRARLRSTSTILRLR